MSEHARELAKSLYDALTQPVASLSDLCGILTPPLAALELADHGQAASSNQEKSGNSKNNEEDWSNLFVQDKAYILKVYWPQYQELLATKILVDWHDQLSNAGLLSSIWLPYFCPSRASGYDSSSSIRTHVAHVSISTLLIILANRPAGHKLSSTEYKPAPLHPLVQSIALQTLAQLVQAYTLSDFFTAFITSNTNNRAAVIEWRAFYDLYISIPARLANIPFHQEHQQTQTQSLPSVLEWRMFLVNASRQLEKCIASLSTTPRSSIQVEALAYALGKIARSGFMTVEKGQMTFWSAIMPSARKNLLPSPRNSTSEPLWPSISSSLTTADYRTFAVNLLATLDNKLGLDASARAIAQSSKLVESILGPLNKLEAALRQLLVNQVFLSRARQPGVAQILVNISGNEPKDRASLLQAVLDVWQEKDVIERAPTSLHTYLTSIILLIIRGMHPLQQELVEQSRSPKFLQAVTAHLSTMREIVRLEGMLVAEEVSKKSLPSDGPVKPLDFGDIWQGQGSSYESIRQLKAWADAVEDSGTIDWHLDANEEEGDVEEVDEPSAPGPSAARATYQGRKASDSNTALPQKPKNGLIQIMSSSSEYDDYDEDIDEPDLQPVAMPPPPLAEDLEDLEDLSAYTPAKKKPKPPVYIADLCAYLKSSEDANKLEVGLREAAALIRRKAKWGSELTDAAVELAFVLSGLQDNFSLDYFEERRQEALAALVASAPEKAAPAVIEQFFTNHYSIQQRSVMLISLAVGARELAGLPVALPGLSTIGSVDASFPTQRLPDRLHDRFSAANADSSSSSSTSAPARSQLEVLTEDITNLALSRTRNAAEDKIPEASREKLLTVRETKRKVERNGEARPKVDISTHHFSGLAVGVFIMPLVNRFWLYMRDVATSPQDFRTGVFRGGAAGSATLFDPMVLSRFLGTLTVLLEAGRRSPHFLAVLAPEALELVLAVRGVDAGNEAVQASMLQLTLVVLEGSYDLDGGRTLARDFSKTVWQIKDWAEDRWKQHEGQAIGSVGRAAAGVLLRLDDVVTKTIGYV